MISHCVIKFPKHLCIGLHSFNLLDFVLELCEGGNLLNFKTQITESLKDHSRSFSIQLISAVKYLHSMGIIHRDIKPENILLLNRKQIKLADFGSCIDMNKFTPGSQKTHLNDLGKFVGTPEYLAPEILKNCVKSGQTAFSLDWWALGCTIHWLLTDGKVLFEASTEYLVYKSIEAGPSATSLKKCCDLDGILAEIVFGLLERDPLKRMAFIKDQLDNLVNQL
jgi:protein kinase A